MNGVSGCIETGYVGHAGTAGQQIGEKGFRRMPKGAGQSHTGNDDFSMLVHFVPWRPCYVYRSWSNLGPFTLSKGPEREGPEEGPGAI